MEVMALVFPARLPSLPYPPSKTRYCSCTHLTFDMIEFAVYSPRTAAYSSTRDIRLPNPLSEDLINFFAFVLLSQRYSCLIHRDLVLDYLNQL